MNQTSYSRTTTEETKSFMSRLQDNHKFLLSIKDSFFKRFLSTTKLEALATDFHMASGYIRRYHECFDEFEKEVSQLRKELKESKAENSILQSRLDKTKTQKEVVLPKTTGIAEAQFLVNAEVKSIPSKKKTRKK